MCVEQTYRHPSCGQPQRRQATADAPADNHDVDCLGHALRVGPNCPRKQASAAHDGEANVSAASLS